MEKKVIQVEQESAPSCQLRVYLHGPLEVWKREASGTWTRVEKDAWGKGRGGRSVFKRLLATPGRRLSRGAIQEDLWPDSEDFELAEKSTYNAIHQIRRVLGKTVIRTIEASYELADQSVLWLDRDACEILLKEAENRGHSSVQALPLLEEALGYLERGELLEGESGIWVYGVRTKSEDLLRQCRLWQAEAYEAQAKLWQAGEQYRALLQTMPPDEEALLAWIAMLARHGRTQEAVKCYQDVKGIVEAQGCTLSPAIEQVTLSLNEHFDPSKRTALEQFLKSTVGVTLASPLQGLAQLEKFFHTEEFISLGATSVPVYWRLYFDGHLAEVSQVLPSHLSQLSTLAEQPSTYQMSAASVASKGHQLACMLALQPQDYTSALIHADQAIQYAHVAEDFNVLTASLIRKALVYFYLRQPTQRLWAYKEASQYINKVSPLLQGRIYMGLAETHSSLAAMQSNPEHEHQALHFLELMHKTFPAHPKEDQHFAYTHFKLPQGYEGLVYLNLKQPRKAWDVLTEMDKALPVSVVPDRVELTVIQARALIDMGDLTQGRYYLGIAVNTAKALGSTLRQKESFALYQQMLVKWPHEQQVKELAELFACHDGDFSYESKIHRS